MGRRPGLLQPIMDSQHHLSALQPHLKQYLSISTKINLTEQNKQQLVEIKSTTKRFKNFPGFFFFPDDTNVNYSDKLKLEVLPSAKSESKSKSIRTVNFPMVSFWHRVSHKFEDVKYSEIFSRQFGELLSKDFLMNFLRSKMLTKRKCLDDFNCVKQHLLDQLQISDARKFGIWSDQLFGFSSVNGLRVWMQMVDSQSNGIVIYNCFLGLIK